MVMGTIPNHFLRPQFRKAIQEQELLVVGARQPSWLTEQADWILPITHPFEENDVCIHRNPELPCLALPRSNALYPPFEESRSIDEIFKSLSSHLSLVGLCRRHPMKLLYHSA